MAPPPHPRPPGPPPAGLEIGFKVEGEEDDEEVRACRRWARCSAEAVALARTVGNQ